MVFGSSLLSIKKGKKSGQSGTLADKTYSIRAWNTSTGVIKRLLGFSSFERITFTSVLE